VHQQAAPTRTSSKSEIAEVALRFGLESKSLVDALLIGGAFVYVVIVVISTMEPGH
jgi:hypothetical protein